MGLGINLGDLFDLKMCPAINRSIWIRSKSLGLSMCVCRQCWDTTAEAIGRRAHNISPAFFETIKEIVDDAIDLDLKIIVNMHHHTKMQKIRRTAGTLFIPMEPNSGLFPLLS